MPELLAALVDPDDRRRQRLGIVGFDDHAVLAVVDQLDGGVVRMRDDHGRGPCCGRLDDHEAVPLPARRKDEAQSSADRLLHKSRVDEPRGGDAPVEALLLEKRENLFLVRPVAVELGS